jgi:hypothetical protein
LFRFLGVYTPVVSSRVCKVLISGSLDRSLLAPFASRACKALLPNDLVICETYSLERQSSFALPAAARSTRDLGFTGSRLNTALRRSYMNDYSTTKVTSRQEKVATLWLRGGTGIEFCCRMAGQRPSGEDATRKRRAKTRRPGGASPAPTGRFSGGRDCFCRWVDVGGERPSGRAGGFALRVRSRLQSGWASGWRGFWGRWRCWRWRYF